MRRLRPIIDWFSTWVRQDGTAAAAIAVGALLSMAALGYYLAPERVEAPTAIHNMTQDLLDVQASEKRSLSRYQAFVDPAPLFARRLRESGRADMSILASYVDESHWFIKVRHDAAKTICVQLMTILDDVPPRPRCREATTRDMAERAKAVVPAVREPLFFEAQ